MEPVSGHVALRSSRCADKLCATYAVLLMVLLVTVLPSARSQRGTSPPPTAGPVATGGMSSAPARPTSLPATGSRPPATGSHPPANGSHPPATGSHPPATGSTPPATGTRPPATDARSPPPVAMTTPGIAMTTAIVSCPPGYWSRDCSQRCDCNGHPCNQFTAACQCPRCFSGDSCNITAAGGKGRKCVQDFFNARTREELGSLKSEIQRLPRQLPESDIESIMSDYAATSVNRIRSPKYDVIAKPGGGELAQIRCILAESTARATLANKIKSGSIGATVIINDVTNEVVLNKPNLA